VPRAAARVPLLYPSPCSPEQQWIPHHSYASLCVLSCSSFSRSPMPLPRTAVSPCWRVQELTTRAGVHRCRVPTTWVMGAASGIGEGGGGAGVGELAVFRWLAEQFEHLVNSGSSSRERTPWWARLTSPGLGTAKRQGRHR
jgi:hypothetical protein